MTWEIWSEPNDHYQVWWALSSVWIKQRLQSTCKDKGKAVASSCLWIFSEGRKKKKGRMLTLKLAKLPTVYITAVHIQWFHMNLLLLVKITINSILFLLCSCTTSHSCIICQFNEDTFRLSPMTILQNSELSFLGKTYLNCILFILLDWQWLIIIPHRVNFI